MVFKSREEVDIQKKDLISWYFDEPRCDTDKPIYIDALDPTRYYTQRQAKDTIRKLVAGFRAQGLRKGDVVCIHSFNSVRLISNLTMAKLAGNNYHSKDCTGKLEMATF